MSVYTHWLATGERRGLSGNSSGKELTFVNSTAYRYWKLVAIGGTVSQTYWREIEFRVSGSYADAISTGNRTATITLTTSASLFTGTATTIIDGVTGSGTAYIPNQTLDATEWIKFDLGSAKALNAIKLYTELGLVQGQWDFQASTDDVSYATIATFRGVTQTTSTSLFSSAATNILDGVTGTNVAYIPNQTLDATEWIKWDFASPYVLDAIKLYTELTNAQGTWQLAGSTNDSSWTDIGSSFALAGSSTGAEHTFTNSTQYRYYRISAVSGTVSQTWWREIEFSLSENATHAVVGAVAGTSSIAGVFAIQYDVDGFISGTSGISVTVNRELAPIQQVYIVASGGLSAVFGVTSYINANIDGQGGFVGVLTHTPFSGGKITLSELLANSTVSTLTAPVVTLSKTALGTTALTIQ